MRFRSDIIVNGEGNNTYAKLIQRTDLSIGDTIVVTKDFTYNDVKYHTGDLLVIGAKSGKSENSDGVLAVSDIAVTHVNTGYGEALNLDLVPSVTNNAAEINLQHSNGDIISTVSIVGSGNINFTLDNTNANDVKIIAKLAWGAEF
jgi:hypothetical protein